MKLILWSAVISGLLFSNKSFAQSNFGRLEDNLIPQSPEATAIIKHVALPVTLYTGLPQVSVPIFEIKGHTLSLPIALSYDFNGYKPSETASRVGLGWSIQGGGVITRMVKGRVDNEDANVIRQYDDYVDVNILTRKQTVTRDIAEGYIDGEPDLYVFSCGSLSGKFIIHKGHAYTFPYQNIRIQGSTGGFMITAENGDRYFFDAPEVTDQLHQVPGTLPVPQHESAWFLTKIISADLVDTITYQYSTSSYFRQPPYVDKYTITDATAINGGTHYWEKVAGTGNGITTQILSSIHYKNTSVSFVDGTSRTDEYYGSAALASVVVTNHDVGPTFTKVFALSHNYQNWKLNLVQVNVTDHLTSPTETQTYKFEYEGGINSNNGIYNWASLERSIDQWGYYNGAVSNQYKMMFTEDDIYLSPYQYGNRATNLTYCKTNALRKLVYPTGGQTLFEYEQNKFSSGSTEYDGPGIRVKRVLSFDDINNPVPAQIKKYTYGDAIVFYNGYIYGGALKRHDSRCDAGSDPDKLDYTLQASIPPMMSELLNMPFYYGTVTETSQSSENSGLTEYKFNSYNSEDPDIYLAEQTEKIFKNNSLIPVRRVTHTDVIVPKFSFIGTTASLSDIIGTGSLCQLVPTPDLTQPVEGLEQVYQAEPSSQFVSAYRKRQQTQETTWDGDGANPLTVSINYYYDNPDHAYPTRTVTQNSKGQVLTTYVKYPLDYLPSSVSSRSTMDAAYTTAKIQAMQNYGYCHSALESALASYQPFSSHSTAFSNITSSYHCEADYLTASTTAITNRNTAWTQYYQGLNTARTNSTIPWKTSVYWMLENNLFSPAIETYTTVQRNGGEYLVSATRNEFILINAGPSVFAAKLGSISQVEVADNLLKSTFLANPDNYYRKQAEFEYNTAVQLVAQWKINDAKQSFVWSDNSPYVLAASTNSAPADLAYTGFEFEGNGNWSGVNNASLQSAGGLTGTRYYQQNSFSLSKSGLNSSTTYRVSYWSKNGSYSITGTESNYPKLRQTVTLGGAAWTLYEHLVSGQSTVTITGSGSLDELRLCPQGAQMSTYSYQQLVGVTAQTDANNRITFYEYDGFGRLSIVRDQDQRVLKKYAYHHAGPPVDYGTGCNSFNPIWQNTATAARCRVINGLNTGQLEHEQIDANPCSSTFNSIQWNVTDDYAYSSCPPACEYSGCVGNGPQFRCVNGVCEEGIKVYTDTYTNEEGYVCVYHYEWSDMWSENFTEISEWPCNND